MSLRESTLDPKSAVFDEVLPAGRGWSHVIARGQTFRIVDLEGNQAVDTLFYSSASLDERYSAQDTIRAQGNIYLTSGTKLWLLDEVMTSLDKGAVALIRSLIEEHLAGGGIAIVATHQDLSVAAGSSQRLELAT